MTANRMSKSKLALVVQVEEQYETLKMVARVCYRDDVKEPNLLLNPSWDYGNTTAEVFEGFEITAYLGGLSYSSSADNDMGTWGLGYAFRPYKIDKAAHAAAIAKTMVKLNKGLTDLRDAEGYVGDSEFHTYILRIARVLGIKEVHVRNSVQARANSGDFYRKVDAPGLQYWISDKVTLVREGKKREAISG